MSGGHFNDCGYEYYKVHQFADELEEELRTNFEKNEYGYSHDYSEEICEYLTVQVNQLRKMSEIMRAIDYLYSSDYGEDSFMARIHDIELKYNEMEKKNGDKLND